MLASSFSKKSKPNCFKSLISMVKVFTNFSIKTKTRNVINTHETHYQPSHLMRTFNVQMT